MSTLEKLMARRDSAAAEAGNAVVNAKGLALTDPKAAADALRQADDLSLDAKVAAMAVDEQTRLDAEEAERQEIAARARVARELLDTTVQQNIAAQKFDEAAAQLEAAFGELEALHQRAEAQREQAGLPAARDFAGRTIGLTRALWHGCPGVAKRLRLGFAPGRGRSPLVEAYPKEN